MWPRFALLGSAALLVCTATTSFAQTKTLGDGPWYYTASSPTVNFKVSVVARGIKNAWGMALLPNGDALIAETEGRLRLVRGGKLEAAAITGLPTIAQGANAGLMDVVLHPEFASNHLVYFTYMKPGTPPSGETFFATTALGRGKLNESSTALTEVADVFVADAWSAVPGGMGSRIRFAPDGTLLMSSPFRRDFERPQDPGSHISKLLHLNDDGTPAADNPFIGMAGYQPEIWSIGHRAMEGIAYHPVTGELWASEHGPQGGDEVNIIQKGGNYGWPVVSFGRDYSGTRVSETPVADGMLLPELIWVPSIATSGMMFYTGNKFPEWQNDLFVGGLMKGRIPGTGHVERIEFNENGEQKRETLLDDLHQRIRDVQQGPDGQIYVLTDEQDGALLVIEPV